MQAALIGICNVGFGNSSVHVHLMVEDYPL